MTNETKLRKSQGEKSERRWLIEKVEQIYKQHGKPALSQIKRTVRLLEGYFNDLEYKLEEKKEFLYWMFKLSKYIKREMYTDTKILDQLLGYVISYPYYSEAAKDMVNLYANTFESYIDVKESMQVMLILLKLSEMDPYRRSLAYEILKSNRGSPPK